MYVLSARGRCHQMLSHSLAESETGEWNLVSTRGLPLFVIEISGLLWNYHYIILVFKYTSFPFIDKILSFTLDIPIRLFCNGNYLWFFCVAKIDVFLSSNLIVDCSWLNFLHVVILGFFKGKLLVCFFFPFYSFFWGGEWVFYCLVLAYNMTNTTMPRWKRK